MKKEIEQEVPDTLLKLLRYQYRKYGDSKIAMREKDFGIWRKYTWSDYYSIVKYLSMAFIEIGLKKGDTVCIIGENKPHVYWFELASFACGAAVVGIFSDCSASEISFFVEHSGSRFVVCQDQEQVDKILLVKKDIPWIEKIIFWEEKGMWEYEDPLLMKMDEMLKMGQTRASMDPDLFDKMVSTLQKDDIAIFFYSSGTTGLPKAAVHTHQNLVTMGEFLDRAHPAKDTDETVSFLPVAWLGEQLYNVVHSLCKGFTINFPESQETVKENIREIGPHMIFFGPALWEELIRTIKVKMAQASWLNRICFKAAMKVGYRVGDVRMRGKRLSLALKLLHVLTEKFVFRPLRDRLGLSRVRIARTAGAAISPDAIRYFHAIGVPLIQLYGSTETGIATIHRMGDIKPESSGTLIDGYDIKISEEGEILVKSPCLFKEYHKDPEKTAKTVIDGWYHSGDFGHFDKDGHLIVMDRMEDLQPMAGGKRFSPQFIETRLRFSPYIKEVFVVGKEDQAYPVGIINIDYNNVANWADENHIAYTTFTDLSQKAEVIGLVKEEIREINNYIPDWTRLKKFVNLHKEFDADEAELTRTRKIRRSFLAGKYKEIIDALFGNTSSVEVTATITYQDGTQGELKSSVSINHIS